MLRSLNPGEKGACVVATQGVRTSAFLLLSFCLGAAGQALFSDADQQVAAQTGKAAPTAPDLNAEIEAIKAKLPDQAHAMQDVGYHFSNLWFARQEENWPLAEFYNAETSLISAGPCGSFPNGRIQPGPKLI